MGNRTYVVATGVTRMQKTHVQVSNARAQMNGTKIVMTWLVAGCVGLLETQHTHST